MMKRLLVLTSTFPRYKGDTTPPFVYELSKRLTDNFKVYILAPFSYHSKKRETMEGMSIFRFRYWFNKKNNLADGAILPNLKSNAFLSFQVIPFLISELFSTINLIRRKKINVIHAHWILPQGFIAVLCKLLFFKKIRVVVTTHGGDIFGAKYANFIKRFVINHCDSVSVVSTAIKKELLKIGVKKNVPVKVLPMGVDTEKFSPNKKDNRIKRKYGIKGNFLLFVGRLSEKKGVEYLIRAMPAILKKNPDTKLLIIGDGELRKSLVKLTKDKELSENIIFTGGIDKEKLPPYFATADLFIAPFIEAKGGDKEGFGLVVAEAMSSGCVSVSSDIPAVRDIIEDGKNGFFVPQKDINNISLKVLDLIDRKKKLVDMQKRARKHIIDNFEWKKVSEEYNKLLENG